MRCSDYQLLTQGICSRYTGRESPLILFAIPDGHTKESVIAAPAKKTKEITNKEVSYFNFRNFTFSLQ
jgi:hypothetical protein